MKKRIAEDAVLAGKYVKAEKKYTSMKSSKDSEEKLTQAEQKYLQKKNNYTKFHVELEHDLTTLLDARYVDYLTFLDQVRNLIKFAAFCLILRKKKKLLFRSWLTRINFSKTSHNHFDQCTKPESPKIQICQLLHLLHCHPKIERKNPQFTHQ